MLLNNSIFQKIELLDENFFFSGEIADLCLRMKNANLPFVCLKDLKIKHLSTDNHNLRKSLYIYYNFRNRFLLIDKHHQTRKKELYQIWKKRIRRQMFGALIRGNFSKCITLYRALKDGIGNRYGKAIYDWSK